MVRKDKFGSRNLVDVILHAHARAFAPRVSSACESELTLMLRQTLPLCCTLVVNLKGDAVLQIKTTATDALVALSSGNFATHADPQIFDTDGRLLRQDELAQLASSEQAFWLPSKLTDPN